MTPLHPGNRYIPLDDYRHNNYSHGMATTALEQKLKQTKGFSSVQQAVLLGLQVAAHRVWDQWTRFLKAESELTPNQYNVLRILRGAGVAGHTSGAIAERMITRDPDVTRLVDRLARRGLVRRVRDEDDRRVVRLFITRTGLEVLERLDEPIVELPQRVLGSLSETELRQLRDLLDLVIQRAATWP